MRRRFFNRRVALCLCFCMAVNLLTGCAGAKKPLPGEREPGAKLGKEPSIRLYINETGEIKNIKMEEYIQGVVAAEMDTKWPINALAAQAILARTFTLKQIKDKGGVPKYKADASTSVEEFQAFDQSRINDNVRQAVNMTRGEVVKYKNDYINAWFSACDGGVEASAAEGLSYKKEETPYIKAGVEDGCLSITVPENVSWTAKFPLGTVRAAVQQVTGNDPGDINAGNIGVAGRGPSGRAETLKIGTQKVGGAALRLALGNEKMRSIYLDKMWIDGGNLAMSGKGYGHGVGMCQWGAKKMAAEGKTPEQIIQFYFKDISIEKEWK
ncbi:SpoIID/LytB domain-containing protein [Phosphitispora fastidiosa]|uniref:SpoIID/LytB domain-containing protein n=1 Tax=Phosphitispora fastidiosa TaxID=2837202 RepID=UPI001E4FB46F|nr:SpoIID/LytB domain-containing protein [Phosphitispora fastidiosa]MBU7007802.1 stage II sporulation protein D [Phosphitispora fastidiosa]